MTTISSIDGLHKKASLQSFTDDLYRTFIFDYETNTIDLSEVTNSLSITLQEWQADESFIIQWAGQVNVIFQTKVVEPKLITQQFIKTPIAIRENLMIDGFEAAVELHYGNQIVTIFPHEKKTMPWGTFLRFIQLRQDFLHKK